MSPLGVSRGIAMGKALVYEREKSEPSNISIRSGDVEKEKRRVQAAIKTAVKQIQKIIDGIEGQGDSAMRELMKSYIELTEDPLLTKQINEYIETSLCSASDAALRATEDGAKIFSQMEDAYFRARAADVRDVGMRIVRSLTGREQTDLAHIGEDCILVAQDLLPSETILMNKEHVLGFITQQGSQTSHTAIVANILSLPAIVGANIQGICPGDFIVMDGSTGEMIVNPSDEDRQAYEGRKKAFLEKQKSLEGMAALPAKTTDGHGVELHLNIADPREGEQLDVFGADGIGLFRTEFLFMETDEEPDEETQFKAYREVAERCNGKPTVIRTLDISGDKKLPYLSPPEEENPFFGYRTMRLCLENPGLVKTQLRAILRGSVFGPLKILFPMICAKNELLFCKTILNECKRELAEENISFAENIPVGMMVEIPSAAAAAHIFAKEVDFFSIGTNDLCQYSLAVDRMNPAIPGLYTHFDPGVLRLIKNTIEQAHCAGIACGMCGEMAGDVLAVPLLLGLGLDEFSVSPSNVLCIKERIRSFSLAEAKAIAAKVLGMDNAREIQDYLRECAK